MTVEQMLAVEYVVLGFVNTENVFLGCGNDVFAPKGECFWAIGMMFLYQKENAFGLWE